jgi:hypothetical protein
MQPQEQFRVRVDQPLPPQLLRAKAAELLAAVAANSVEVRDVAECLGLLMLAQANGNGEVRRIYPAAKMPARIKLT